jgi:eukaryotic-like serine/threonine-protein kinase
MNPSPEDPSEFEAPMTRAGFATEGERSEAKTEIDSDRTINLEDKTPTLAMTDPAMTRVPEAGLTSNMFTDWIIAESGQKTEDSKGVTVRRGIVGKIEPGQTLYGKYLVLKKLGGGAMGDVWLVRHATLKSEHALKVIVPNFARNALALMRFQREFEVMATLRHEHAVTIYDACIDDEGGYIDMEFVDGLTIDAILTAARPRSDRDPAGPLMPLDWIVRLLDQLCEVLQVAHEKGIVHRDLKPSNMMLLNGRKVGKEYLKVLDFGIAKIRDDPEGASGHEQEESSHKTEGFIGTPSYGSPEQAMARQDVDGRADLYSVGIMLYEFVTGRLPFRGSPLQVMSQNASAPPPPFFEANPRLRSIPEVEHAIFRVLAKDPDHRPQTARELFEEFREAVEAVLPSVSPGLTPSPWDPMPFYGSPSSGLDTEHESQVGGAALPSTMEATLIAPGGRFEPVKPVVESSTDLEPVVLARQALPWKLISTIVALVVASILVMGLIFMIRSRPAVVAAKESGKEELPRFEDYWPANFVAVGDSNKDVAWPDQVRQVPDGRYFNRFADAIYLPDGYTVEDPTQLINGWPKAIIRNGIRFLRIEQGKEWLMGAWDAEVEQGREDVPAHAVRLSGFYIQETEVTNGQYSDYLEKKQSARPTEWEEIYLRLKGLLGRDLASEHPAVNLSRKQAMAFARSIDAQLPTEAQWEYAARSRGEPRRYVWGEMPPPSQMMANIERLDDKTTAPVKSYPNDRTLQGVFDMLGNVQEICRDSFVKYKSSMLPEIDPCEVPLDPIKAVYVIRGANFNSISDDCALTRRSQKVSETELAENVGFRLVVECPAPKKQR